MSKREQVDKALCDYILEDKFSDYIGDPSYLPDSKYTFSLLKIRVESILGYYTKSLLILLSAKQKGYNDLYNYWVKRIFAEMFVATRYDVLATDNSYQRRKHLIDIVYIGLECHSFNYFKRNCLSAAEYDQLDRKYDLNRADIPEPPIGIIEPTEELYKKYTKVLKLYKESFARMSGDNLNQFIKP